jgi:hypothetical protein
MIRHDGLRWSAGVAAVYFLDISVIRLLAVVTGHLGKPNSILLFVSRSVTGRVLRRHGMGQILFVVIAGSFQA